MKQKTRQCQNCKQQFTIEPHDFRFYEKVQVPPPTFCPECRTERRFAFRNEWKEPEKRNYQITMTNDQMPDNIKDVTDDVLDKIIGCAHKDSPAGGCNEHCTEVFRIIPQELKFYRQQNIPLPRLCPNCRHSERVKQRNPLKLWQRKCMCQNEELKSASPFLRNEKNKGLRETYKNTATHFHPHTKNFGVGVHAEKPCPNEFKTSYGPKRKEIVYCETCYLQEVA